MSLGGSPVLVMQTADVRKGDDLALVRGLNRSWVGRLFVQREMGSCPVVIREVRRKKPFEMTLVDRDYMVETLAADRTDESLDIGRLPG